MKEENNGKPVKLSDEEMDMIAGGKAVVAQVNGKTYDIYQCDAENMTSDYFNDILNGKPCSEWATYSYKTDRVCTNCMHYRFHGEMPGKLVKNYLEYLNSEGYGSKYVY